MVEFERIYSLSWLVLQIERICVERSVSPLISILYLLLIVVIGQKIAVRVDVQSFNGKGTENEPNILSKLIEHSDADDDVHRQSEDANEVAIWLCCLDARHNEP